MSKRKYFTTGSKNLDKILGGGMPTSAIVEINGEYRTGKTQTCLTCAVTAQLPEEQGGLGRPVIYFDTENSFQAEHLQGIGVRFGFDKDEVLDNLFVVQAEQLRYLSQAIDRLPGYVQALDPGLIIIDSLMAPFRNEFHELNLLAVRQKKIGKLIGLLKRIAIAFNTSVIFTNQVMANIGSMGAKYNPVIAAGGHVVAHASDIRINMKKRKDTLRFAKIQDCAWLPTESAEFYITPMGIADVEKIILDGTEDEEVIEETATIEDDSATPMLAGIKEAKKSRKEKAKPIKNDTTKMTEELIEEPIEEPKEIQEPVKDEAKTKVKQKKDEIITDQPKEPKVKSKSAGKKSKVPA
ncbi:MAG: ATPase domain-containing protein [Candidatus Heimdallarchaeota archaeon]